MATIKVALSPEGSFKIPVFPSSALAVVPSDVDIYDPPVTVYVGVGGAVVIEPAFPGDGSTVTFTGVPAGALVPCRARRVLATGTTATNMVATAP